MARPISPNPVLEGKNAQRFLSNLNSEENKKPNKQDQENFERAKSVFQRITKASNLDK